MVVPDHSHARPFVVHQRCGRVAGVWTNGRKKTANKGGHASQVRASRSGRYSQPATSHDPAVWRGRYGRARIRVQLPKRKLNLDEVAQSVSWPCKEAVLGKGCFVATWQLRESHIRCYADPRFGKGSSKLRVDKLYPICSEPRRVPESS